MKYLLLLVSILPWLLKRLAYQTLLEAEIAPTARIGFGSWIVARELKLGDGAVIGPFVYANCNVLILFKGARIERLGHISVGRVELGRFAKLGKKVEITGDRASHESSVVVGANSWVFQETLINAGSPVVIGNNVGIGGRSLLFTHGYWLSRFRGFPYAKGGITIKDNVWLPWECFIMPGVSIGENVVVGARSVITKSVPAGSLVAGVPAKVLKTQSWVDLDDVEILRLFEEWVSEYQSHVGASDSVINLGSELNATIFDLVIKAVAIHSDVEVTLAQADGKRFSFALIAAVPLGESQDPPPDWASDFIVFGRRYGFKL